VEAMDVSRKLEKAEDFGEIFSLVKMSVEKAIARRRDGLMLALQYLPEELGAYYGVGSNFIVMNKALLEKVAAHKDKSTLKSYIYYILMHEYLHSLGFLNEALVRDLSYQICRQILGDNHESTKMARKGIASVIPIDPRPRKQPEEIEIVEHFDTESISYIG
jgi:hypothetical protein